ncbi:MAG: class I SAM-dependent methyltransferase [Bacteroidales bacterium]
MSKTKYTVDPDAYGKGLLAWFNGDRNARFNVWSDIAETEKWDISIFFRDYEEMPDVEIEALKHCKGRVLDVGAGAGSHALYLQDQGLDVVALDLSEGATEVMTRRGVKQVTTRNFFDFYSDEKFDTLLMLMNGIGIVEKVKNLPNFFQKAKELLSPNGSVIVDSSNIIYMFEEEDGSALIDLNADYYGEVIYRMDYGKMKGTKFNWLFIDFDTLADYASRCGFSCTKIYEDEHYLYLAELKRIDE